MQTGYVSRQQNYLICSFRQFCLGVSDNWKLVTCQQIGDIHMSTSSLHEDSKQSKT